MTRAEEIYRELLPAYIAFKSISTDKKYGEELVNCASWLQDVFWRYGFDVSLVVGYGNPVIIARYKANKPRTYGIYGHHDVQPAEMADGWKSDPFVVTERDGRFYCRGASDNKGQTLIHMAAIFAHIEAGTLGKNVVFFIEGDEESSGAHLRRFIEDHEYAIGADCWVISDGQCIGSDPNITPGLRGGFNMKAVVKTANVDLHSGIYGGTIANSLLLACKFVALFDDKAKEAIRWSKECFDMLPPEDGDKLKRDTGATLTVAERHALYIRAYHPCFEITGLSGGYAKGEGYRNAIPGETIIKMNFRVPPKASAKEAAERVKALAAKVLDDVIRDKGTFTIDIESPPEDGILMNSDNEHLRHVQSVAQKVTGKPIPLIPWGASIPAVRHMHEVLKVPVVLLSLAPEDCKMHGVEENMTEECLKQGLAISTELFADKK